MRNWIEKIKHNHILMMIICCVAPIAIMLAAVYFFGLSKSYLFWTVVLVCPISHLFMMKSMHDDSGKKSKGGCH